MKINRSALVVAVALWAVLVSSPRDARPALTLVPRVANRFSCGSSSLTAASAGVFLASPGTTTQYVSAAVATVSNGCTIRNLSCTQCGSGGSCSGGSATPTISVYFGALGGSSASSGVLCTVASSACTDSTHTRPTTGPTALYCVASGATADSTNLTCSFDCN